jgi:hypothetical protein
LTQDLKQQANAFVQNKIDSTKKAVKAAIKDTVKSLKQQVINDVKNEAIKQIFKTGDTTKADPKKTLEEAGQNLLKNFNPFKKG